MNFKAMSKTKKIIICIVVFFCAVWFVLTIKSHMFTGEYYHPTKYNLYACEAFTGNGTVHQFIEFLPEKEQFCYIQYNRDIHGQIYGIATYLQLKAEQFPKILPGLYLNLSPKMPWNIFSFDTDYNRPEHLALRIKPVYYVSYNVNLNTYERAPKGGTTWIMKTSGPDSSSFKIEGDLYCTPNEEELMDYEELFIHLNSEGEYYYY